MSTLVESPESRFAWEPPVAKPLDEAGWQAWARVKAVKWVSAALLIAAAGLWPRLEPYEVVVGFIVAAGAIVVMSQAFHARRYAFVAVFGSSGGWQRALLVASAVAFAASLAWRNVRLAREEMPNEGGTRI